ncbi:DUF1361 domain-containing protein [Hymenobacter sp. BT770]|uniref:DUF1361 domain-containing protein n=1 Tax=Hymenobacter sp. BT770 TaxID=2886942 RepID=UPI001D113299|nr:DUF1361 domain-containing protein [Hymenobacter sp. BT770]MCC3152233.1 DUF1361 domain-containing protein [Hymenobacter sp. BT770]MDO3414047.1 DUF1361 domain-containing protein [Hymenobacter sp. BT770]
MSLSSSLPFSRARLTLVFVLAASITLSLLLVVGRMAMTGRLQFLFLLWNLFLAVVPFALSTLLGIAQAPLRTRMLVPVSLAWILFFPNAPYLLTDLFHLNPRPGVPLWYDLALILSCAWNGLMLAYASLSDMQQLVQRRLGTWVGWAFATVALLLSSFGIYLGRYLRFNSWDVLTNPLTLFYDIVNRVLHPFSFPGTWGVTLVFGLFLLVGYGTVRLLGRTHEDPIL